jgi:putative FmdB family regulatory protein
MPLYTYKCRMCEKVFDEFKPLAHWQTPALHCGVAASKQITAPMIVPDYPGYESPATGQWIEGKRAHVEDLKRSGCRLLEPGETEAYIKRNTKEEREKQIVRDTEAIVSEVAKEIMG